MKYYYTDPRLLNDSVFFQFTVKSIQVTIIYIALFAMQIVYICILTYEEAAQKS